jgi:hypothetical protein
MTSRRTIGNREDSVREPLLVDSYWSLGSLSPLAGQNTQKYNTNRWMFILFFLEISPEITFLKKTFNDI